MTLGADKFMRRFLLHVLPRGFHRIRRYGLLANGNRMASLALARALLGQPGAAPLAVENTHTSIDRSKPCLVCAHCGAAMTILKTLVRGQSIRAPPASPSKP